MGFSVDTPEKHITQVDNMRYSFSVLLQNGGSCKACGASYASVLLNLMDAKLNNCAF
jgi:hypothetical protein